MCVFSDILKLFFTYVEKLCHYIIYFDDFSGGTPIVIDSLKSTDTVSSNNSASDKTCNPIDKITNTPISSAQPVVKLVKLSPSSIASSSCDTISNQEQIVEKAKQVKFCCTNLFQFIKRYFFYLKNNNFLQIGSLCDAENR